MEKDIQRKAFFIYNDFMELVEDLTDEEAGKLFKAMGAYAISQKAPAFEKDERLLKVMFKNFKAFEDENRKKWEKAQAQRSEAGKASAEARKRKKEKAAEEEKPVSLKEKYHRVNEAYQRELQQN